MLFSIGIIIGTVVGLLIAVLIVATLTFFRRPIEQKVEIIEKQVDSVAPKQKGFTIMPQTDAEESREKVKEKYREKGIEGIPIDELR